MSPALSASKPTGEPGATDRSAAREASARAGAPCPRPTISVIVPTFNEAACIRDCLAAARCGAHELIVVDGGSRDSTRAIAARAGAAVLEAAERGRAAQMNAGAAVACGDVLLFLHADTLLPPGWARAVGAAARPAVSAAAMPPVSGATRHSAGATATRSVSAAWGRFDVRLDDPSPLLAIVGALMNLRSRLTGICTGDQAMFVTRAAWRAVGGFPAIPLMEDIELSRRLKRSAGRPACLPERVLVSARRWRGRGVLRTIAGMWAWRALYFLGASPRWLQRRYYGREP